MRERAAVFRISTDLIKDGDTVVDRRGLDEPCKHEPKKHCIFDNIEPEPAVRGADRVDEQRRSRSCHTTGGRCRYVLARLHIQVQLPVDS